MTRLDPGVQVCPHCGARYVGLVTTDGSKFCRQCEGWWVGTHRAGDAPPLPPAKRAVDVLAEATDRRIDRDTPPPRPAD
jgi:hypothetical protein